MLSAKTDGANACARAASSGGSSARPVTAPTMARTLRSRPRCCS